MISSPLTISLLRSIKAVSKGRFGKVLTLPQLRIIISCLGEVHPIVRSSQSEYGHMCNTVFRKKFTPFAYPAHITRIRPLQNP